MILFLTHAICFLIGAFFVGASWIFAIVTGNLEFPQPRDRKGRFMKVRP